MTTPTFRTFYHFLLNPDEAGREPWRDLDRALLLDWADRLDPAMRGLDHLAPAEARHLRGDAVLGALWALYALSRVNDLLLLPFQPPASPEQDAAQPVAPISLDDYRAFWERLGLRAHAPRAFHPFFCEIVAVEPAADPQAPAQIVAVHWPALRFSDLLISRAGVSVRAGANLLDPAIAPHATLYFTHRRHARPTFDLSLGWGHNSQWRTAFRRDYIVGETLCYNVDGTIDVWAPSPERDLRYLVRDNASPRARYELLVHRSFVRTAPQDGEGLVETSTAIDLRHDDDTPWQMPPASARDEDLGRLTRWLWHTEPQPPPPGAPPTLGQIAPARFFRLLDTYARARGFPRWNCGLSLSQVGERHGIHQFPVSTEVVLMALMAASTDGWIYLVRPGLHWKEMSRLETFPAVPITEETIAKYIDPEANYIICCTVGVPEDFSHNDFSLGPSSPASEREQLIPFGAPADGSDPEDLANLARLYPEVRALARADGDAEGEAHATLRLGAVTVALGDVAAGAALLDEALALAEALGNRLMVAAALGERGLAQAAAGDRPQGLRLLDRAVGLAALAGDDKAAERWAERRERILAGDGWAG